MTVDPRAIIADGIKAAARQERRHNLILGVILIAAGVAFAVLGILGVSGTNVPDSTELVFAMFGLAGSAMLAGIVKVWRGLQGRA